MVATYVCLSLTRYRLSMMEASIHKVIVQLFCNLFLACISYIMQYSDATNKSEFKYK
jgi:hypothetical protein